jgi:hydroxymethylglutaryl-CoA lyase
VDPESLSSLPAADRVRYVECPRDAWQGLDRAVPSARKLRHLRLLLDAGFVHLDLASFVSPRAVPQMADSDRVVADLAPPVGADLLGIVLNLRGLDRALGLPQLGAVGYPLSVSDTFQRRNSGRSVAESWPLMERLRTLTIEAERRFVVYLSMGFGNPFGDRWSPAESAAAVERLRALGVDEIVLADTVGRAGAERIATVLDAVAEPQRLGLHLHARPDGWEPLLEAALDRGVRWIEGALAGIGGCPFAGDALVGNLPSERVIPWLRDRGLDVEAPTDLSAVADDAAEIALLYGAPGR